MHKPGVPCPPGEDCEAVRCQNMRDKEEVIIRLFDGGSDTTIRQYEREAARKIINIVEESFPGGMSCANMKRLWGFVLANSKE